MAKNELLPFANGEDANVLPTNQWEALTDILENGFQSGIARSEQVNRVLAQGAVASYVLGQLIVDQLNKDATLDKDTLYQNIVKALQENAKDVCLPLTGGTMTGAIQFDTNGTLKSTSDSGSVQIFGGTNYGTGSMIGVYGKSQGDKAGHVWLHATDGTNTKNLIANPNGQLTWDDNEVERLNSAGKGWIRYESGIQICWGYASLGTSETTVTFPAAFSSNSNTSLAVASATQTTYMVYIPPGSFTTFKGKMSASGSIRYIAIGLWK